MDMVHKTLVYQKLYERYSRHFIQAFCSARKSGFNRKHSFALARIKLQDLIIDELVKKPKQTVMIVQAYNSTKRDQQLYDKAISYFKKYNETDVKK